MFQVDQDLLKKARSVLDGWKEVYWVIGGSCSGKSTICRTLADIAGIELYDMDEHIFGSYMDSYSVGRHPASKAWFSAPNPLAWILSLDWGDFDALNRAANAEYLDLLADDLARFQNPAPLLIDGGITHPSVLTQVIPPERVFCLEIPEGVGTEQWDTAEERAEMKGWIYELPRPKEMWLKFLEFDRLISRAIVTESRALDIWTYLRREEMTVNELAGVVAAHFGL